MNQRLKKKTIQVNLKKKIKSQAKKNKEKDENADLKIFPQKV